MVNILSIAIGGFIGAILRFLLSRFIGSFDISSFPLGTFIVNSIGCFFIGLLYTIFERISIFPEIRGFLSIGLIGAFTTFSTYMMETVNLFRDKEIFLGILNIFLSNITGIIFIIIGIYVAKLLFLTRP